ncbi:MAG: N-acetylmuramoyl-L-alanine amidase [Firmicutes bacterium]|nr:N-acetylmuramoyl-L-alanine amidase [Bacillota bacterium]MDI6706328.1 stalk domain-containing protein [Bacillota bacterium]
MKNSKRFLALFLIMVMALSFPLYALADNAGEDDGDRIEQPNDENGMSKGKGNTKQKPAKALKDLVEMQKDEIELVKDQLEQEIDELEALYEAAEESGNLELAAQLMLQLQEMKAQKESYKAQMRDLIGQMKLTMRNRYTEAELEQLRRLAEELGQDPDLFVLPVENIISTKVNFKFDTPPVIKGSRTLIPVRAIVQAFGAGVAWDQETQTVTISKDDKEIVLTLGSSTIYVNGEEYEIDAPAELINNRTFVPLRFLIHNFGLKVKWDEDTQTIEIDDGEEVEQEEELEEEPDDEQPGEEPTEEVDEETGENQ